MIVARLRGDRSASAAGRGWPGMRSRWNATAAAWAGKGKAAHVSLLSARGGRCGEDFTAGHAGPSAPGHGFAQSSKAVARSADRRMGHPTQPIRHAAGLHGLHPAVGHPWASVRATHDGPEKRRGRTCSMARREGGPCHARGARGVQAGDGARYPPAIDDLNIVASLLDGCCPATLLSARRPR